MNQRAILLQGVECEKPDLHDHTIKDSYTYFGKNADLLIKLGENINKHCITNKYCIMMISYPVE